MNGFKNLSVHLNDEDIKLKALKLIKLEEEIKYRKKYTRIEMQRDVNFDKNEA